MEGGKLPAPSNGGKVVTILSIDGGGVRGIIPAIFLMQLEAELQKKEHDEGARIADYFDVIAGTSTGGLITAMLTAPNQHNRPMFSAKEIKDFYMTESPNIFPEECDFLENIENFAWKPKFDGRYLHQTIEDHLKETKLHQTLTRVVIPTFDMKAAQPVIFSSFRLNAIRSLDVKLSDICIGTSAAPTFFPPHHFQEGNREFNLIDGGVIANNPALIAISEVTQQEQQGNPAYEGFESNDFKKIFLVSLGTGYQNPADKYDASKAANWGLVQWAQPAITLALDGSQDLVDYHLASVFRALKDDCHENYLRIQTDELSGRMSEMDCATKENLEDLENLANRLSSETVKRINLETFKLEPVPGGPTNAEAIEKVADFLYKERNQRVAYRAVNN